MVACGALVAIHKGSMNGKCAKGPWFVQVVVQVEGFASLGSLHGEHQTKGKWNRLSVKD